MSTVAKAREPRPDRSVAQRTRLVGRTVLGLGIAYAATWVTPLFRSWGVDLPGEGPATVLWLNWLVVAVLLGYVKFVERQPLSSLLMTKPTSRDLEWAVYFFSGAMIYWWVLSLVRPQPANDGIDTLVALPIIGVVALIITTAITEEILYRGYPIERIASLTGSRWLGAAVSLIVFVIPHVVFFDSEWLLYQGPGTLAIYALYLWRRNLYACMLTHLLINAPILIPTILAR